jgi:hypothetical protein
VVSGAKKGIGEKRRESGQLEKVRVTLDTHPLIDGLRITTARDEWPKVGETGENLALFGEDNIPVPYLEPLSETSYGAGPSGQLTQTVKRFP